ncbi:hydroxypyruvate isomerase family protein [Pollutimonas sp. M17]|uniref:hydroxypyruvate isomerase family protein n=1 Tax=Pollutimonas sp. M17 TaxID=2962065 RepID=UPI0021F46A29|nr:TIM barrel protein [Pollutimonas sp. M17]UYO93138.1 TIM barrel protein [Pollutimonas sp. M17]
MKLCAHLGYQFTEYQGLERLKMAANAGFEAVEWPAIYGFDAHELAARTRELGLRWVQVTLPTGDGAKGEKGLAALPGRQDEYLRGLESAVLYAKALGATMIHPMAGAGVSLSDAATMDVYLRNLELALEMASANGLSVLIEVISAATVPGYAMCTYDLAAQVRERLPEVRLLLDAYHAQILTGDPPSLVRNWAGRVGHVQIADAPGRNEPGTGHIDFGAFFGALKESGYDGWVGCEYKPLGRTHDGLPRLDALRPLL